MPSVETASERLPILWFDDEPKAIRKLAKILEIEKSPLELTVAETIAESRELIASGEFAAVVVDLKTSDHGEDDGADFLLEINEAHLAMPTMVWSGFREDPFYQDRLAKSRVVLQESKTESLPSPLRQL